MRRLVIGPYSVESRTPCAACGAVFPLDVYLDAEDGTKLFVCSACGAVRNLNEPDWRGPDPQEAEKSYGEAKRLLHKEDQTKNKLDGG